MSARPRIVLFHATPVAMEPVLSAFAEDWPEAETVNLLDDGLSLDRAKCGDTLSEDLIDRFVAFGRYAHRIGADGILVTCSAFGPAIDRMAAELPVPVVKPNQAMFEAALGHGDRIGMLATFAPSIATMEEEFTEAVQLNRPKATLTTILVDNAISALKSGDRATHDRLLAEHAPAMAGFDAVMLAHFSTSLAAGAVRERLKRPVLTAPKAAVSRIRLLVEGSPPA